MKHAFKLIKLILVLFLSVYTLDGYSKNKLFKAGVSLPDNASYYYEVFDNDDNKVGDYEFHIKKDGEKWIIKSDFDVYVEKFFVKVTMKETTEFDFDGEKTNWFKTDYHSSLPFQSDKNVVTSGKLNKDGVWEIVSAPKGDQQKIETKQIKSGEFIHFMKMIARFPIPTNTVAPNEVETFNEYDYLDHKIITVKATGKAKKKIDFKGKTYDALVARYETESVGGDVIKFDNGLTYKVYDPRGRGYTLLKDYKIN